jgi:hypothetical protein
VAGRRAGTGLALAAVALSAAGCSLGGSSGSSTTTVTRTVTRTVTVTHTVTQSSGAPSPCAASQLSGAFSVIPGSGAAGQISYDLNFTNRSSSSCTFQGASSAQLLSATGSPLPTHIVPAAGVGLAGAQLSPGVPTVVPARFSPSVPGTGDSQSGPCQPKAYTLEVTLNGGGGTVHAPIKPPTSVCERGTLNFAASQTP